MRFIANAEGITENHCPDEGEDSTFLRPRCAAENDLELEAKITRDNLIDYRNHHNRCGDSAEHLKSAIEDVVEPDQGRPRGRSQHGTNLLRLITERIGEGKP